MRKILYSPGFGAGWTSWQDDREVAKFMLEYKPFIDLLENGGEFTRDDCIDWEFPDGERVVPVLSKHANEVVRVFATELSKRFPNKYICCLGISDLCVAEVDGPVRIEEYDGSETVIEGSHQYEWM